MLKEGTPFAMVKHLIPKGKDPADEKAIQAAIDQEMALLRAGGTEKPCSSELQCLRRRGTTQILPRLLQIYIRRKEKFTLIIKRILNGSIQQTATQST
jgi:hypothetical protein